MNSFTFTESEADSLLRQHGITDAVVTVTDVEEGEIGDVYTVHCKEKDYVVKTFPQEHGVMMKEAAVYQLMEAETQAPVPHVYAASDDHAVIDRDYILMEKLPGQMLDKVSDTLSSDTVTALYTEIGEILRDIHNVTFDTFGWIHSDGTVAGHESNTAYMQDKFAELTRFMEQHSNEELAQDIRSIVDEYKHVFSECGAARFCHNDCHERNIFVQQQNNEWKISGVIDVANAVAADPVSDIARTAFFCFEENGVKRDYFFKGYGADPEPWEDRIAVYELFHALDIWQFLYKKYGEDGATNLYQQVVERVSALQ